MHRLIPVSANLRRRGLMVVAMSVYFCAAMICAGCSSTGSAASAAQPSAMGNGPAADPQVDAALDNSCFDCHSDRGANTWNAKLTPSYLFAASDARKALNFSDWATLDAQQRRALSSAIASEVASGSMPPGDYTFLRPSAELSDQQKRILSQWTAQQMTLPAH
jgi:heme-binding protein